MITANYRAKVYVLLTSRNWEDFGTGHVDIIQEFIDGNSVNYLRVIREGTGDNTESSGEIIEMKKKLRGFQEEEEYILYKPILKEMNYEKNSSQILTWIDKDMEIAVSFQEEKDFEDIWQRIYSIKDVVEKED